MTMWSGHVFGKGAYKSAPFDVLRFTAESAERFIDQNGYLHLAHDDVEWTRIW